MRRSYSTEEKLTIIRKIEAEIVKGCKITEACKNVGADPGNYKRWKFETKDDSLARKILMSLSKEQLVEIIINGTK